MSNHEFHEMVKEAFASIRLTHIALGLAFILIGWISLAALFCL